MSLLLKNYRKKEAIMPKLFQVQDLQLVYLLFAAVIGFVALVYFLGGRKICDMNLAEVTKDDTLML